MAKAIYHNVLTMRQERAQRVCDMLELELRRLDHKLFLLKIDVHDEKVRACAARKKYRAIIADVVRINRVLQKIATKYYIETEFDIANFGHKMVYFET